jgi:hypothetical protein
MPYIEHYMREDYAHTVSAAKDALYASTPGELNYLLTCICNIYLGEHGTSYQTLCEVEGVLSHVSKEMYRRVTAPYEDKKCAERGDVF